MKAKELFNQVDANNNKAKAILKSLIANTEEGFDPSKVDVAGLAEAALDYILKNESMIEGGFEE
ncbi:MAG: hypothetical protein KBS60_00165 [Phascolarctobacterium sp.]|nr:hypothetical protein [Candidatus Phascolarctobacterium caballi]